MAVCKTCGSIVKPGDSFCPVCGQSLFNPEDALICSACGSANAPGTRFCKNCGAVLLKKPKTVQCPVCGSENAEDALYCTVCGSEMPGEFDKDFEVENIEKLQEVLPILQSYASTYDNEFSGLSLKELNDTTYVCPICGKRNNISDTKCRRCGRDKARSEELAMKQRIVSFEDAVEVPDKPHALPVIPVARVQSDKKPEFVNGKKSADSTFINNQGQQVQQGALAGGGYPNVCYPQQQGGFVQGAPIVQPLAIVPYVTQEQPLWQYASRNDYENYKKAKAPVAQRKPIKR